MKFRALSLATIAAAIFVMPASAHHSFAMFDATKEVTMSGTVKEFEWTNPHSWLRVTVNDPKTYTKPFAADKHDAIDENDYVWTQFIDNQILPVGMKK